MSRTKQSLAAEAKFLAKVAEQGGRAITPYISARDKVTVTCLNNHTFQISPHHVNSDNQWCRKCPKKSSLKILSEFQERVAEMNGTIITLSNTSTDSATIRCEFGHQWNATQTSIYKTGAWCPECDKMKGVTYEDKVLAVIEYRGGELLNEYQNRVGYKLQIECEQEHMFEITPFNVLKGNWCPSCSPGVGIKERIEAIIRTKNGELLTPYVNTRTTITLKCASGHIWTTHPGHIRDGSWCPNCPKTATVQAEQRFREEIQKRGGMVLTPYQGIHTHVTIRCGNNHEFSAEPNSIMSMGSWCPKCAGCCPKQAAENFYARVIQLKGKLYGTYTHAYGDVEVECEYGHKWNAVPHNIMANNCWCPTCKASHGERTVRQILERHNIKFTVQKEHPSLLGYRFDFYFLHNGKEFYLEYDGEQHFRWIDFFCKTEEAYQHRRDVDVLKSHTVITNNGYLIRLDYTLADEELESHILTALNGTTKLYVSNKDMYAWILEGVDPKPIQLTLNVRVPAKPITLPIHLILNVIKEVK